MSAKIEVLKGYLFEKNSNIFNEYIYKLYNIKMNYTKNEDKYLTAKKLMNAIKEDGYKRVPSIAISWVTQLPVGANTAISSSCNPSACASAS